MDGRSSTGKKRRWCDKCTRKQAVWIQSRFWYECKLCGHKMTAKQMMSYMKGDTNGKEKSKAK